MATSEADLTEWVDLAAELLLGPATAPSVADVLDLAHRVFDCTVSWNWFDADGTVGWHTVGAPPSWPPPEAVEGWLRDQDRHALLRWFFVTQTVQAMTLERVPWRVADEREVRWTQEQLGSTEMTQQLSMPVEVGAFTMRLGISRRPMRPGVNSRRKFWLISHFSPPR